MSQTKITIIGKLRFSEEKGLEYSLPFGKPPGKQMTAWLEAGPENAHDWPGLGKYPEYPEEKMAPLFCTITKHISGGLPPRNKRKTIGEVPLQNTTRS